MVYLNFQKAIIAYEWMDSHFFLPVYDLDVDWPWKPESIPWITLPWWTPGRTAQQIYVYFDGSSSRDREHAGCGVAAFIFDGEWTFAGALSAHLPAGTTSYGSETAGSAMAVKFIYDLLKLTSISGSAHPEVWLCYDSTSVGEQTIGNWEARQQPQLMRTLRSLMLLIEQRFQVQVHHHHIYGHSGDPGNELVDTLAWKAGQGCPLVDAKHFLDWIQADDFVTDFSWAWFLFRSDVPLRWQGTQLVLPAGPSTRPSSDVVQLPHHTRTPVVCDLRLCLASLNVLTLKGKESLCHGLQGPSRQQAVLQQLFEAGATIFALQETRQKRQSSATDDHYILFASPATNQGHFGITVGFDKLRPHGTLTDPGGHSREVLFRKEHFSIISREPRYLILKVQSPALRCVVIAGHAPHTGTSADECRKWWEALSQQIPHRLLHWDRIVLADANCRLGHFPSDCVGSWQAETDTAHSDAFHDFLRQEQLWIPATYQECHSGDSGTWRHNNGSWFRGDYVAIPQRWFYQECRSWVSEEVDASLAKEDHRAAFVQLRATSEIISRDTKKDSPVFDEEALLLAIAAHSPDIDQCIKQGPMPGWNTDVHTHVQQLSAGLTSTFQEIYEKPPPKPRKTTMTPATWALVTAKRTTRNTLNALQHQQRWNLLRTCFTAWAQGPLSRSDCAEFSTIMAEQDIVIAKELMHFRELGRQVTAALRADDVEFFTNLSTEAAEFMEPHQAKRFWQVIRRSLPQHKQRRSNPAPMALQHLDDQWLPHFHQLECGESVSAPFLVHACHHFQMQRLPEAGTAFELSDFPALPEIEAAFRSTKANRSVGFDATPSGVYRAVAPPLARAFFDLVLKTFLWGAEPIQWKGGPLAVIAKKSDWSIARNFRGIMLLPSVSKRLHAMLRERLLPLFKPVRPMGQIGGFKHQQTPFGSQAIRTLARTLTTKGYSVAVLFIDLSEAFHRLVRELVTGVVNDEYAQRILQAVQESGIHPNGLRQWLQVPGLLQRLGCSPVLLRLLQDIHHHTWFALQHHEFPSQTLRGTRPGSPLADVIFHLLMVDCLVEVNEWISTNQAYATILEEAGIVFDTVCWADDLAIPWATSTAPELAPAVRNLLRFVQQTFARKGMSLNMARGKTSVVAHFVGVGAKEERARLQLTQGGGEWVQFRNDEQVWLHYVPTYKHLGTIFSATMDLDHEIRSRIGVAYSSFQLIAKSILCNRHLPQLVRLKLFRALVLSKLFYGAGSWTPLAATTLKKLRVAVASMARRILGKSSDFSTHTATSTTLLQAGLLEPDAYIALERLRYAASLYVHGWKELHQLLRVEEDVCKDSWLLGLREAIHWYNEVMQPKDEVPDSLDELITFWNNSPVNWKRQLRKLAHRHLHQELLIDNAMQQHRIFFRTLKNAGAQFEPDPFEAVGAQLSYECPCGRVFSTGQGLALHRRKVHGIYSLERPFLQGATCPSCLRHFWTTQRLQQHLSYIPRRVGYNPCFFALSSQGYQADYEQVSFPRFVRGLQRVEALPVQGPQPQQLTALARSKDRWQRELDELLAADEVVALPLNCIGAAEEITQAWTIATQRWFTDFVAANHNVDMVSLLPDLWVDTFVDWVDDYDTWVQDIFLHWGDHTLPAILAEWEDGEAEPLVEDVYYKFVLDLRRFQTTTRINELTRWLERADTEAVEPEPQPHRHPKQSTPGASSTARRFPPVVRNYADQQVWHDALRNIQWRREPDLPPLPAYKELRAKPILVVAHLFSGRRRSKDFHFYLNEWAGERGCNVVILSLDTAVSPSLGNLHHDSVSWKQFLRLLKEGCIAGAMCGSPCETFSAARHNPPPEDAPPGTFWPRPLRSCSRLFGLPKLSRKELRQVDQGSAFFLQVMEVLCILMTTGGCFIAEHPAEPSNPAYASIWRSAIVQILLRHSLCHLTRVQQFRWGCSVRKPTGLLHFNIPYFTQSMYAHSWDLPAPTDVAIGMKDNAFLTAAHKEYPEQFGKALAHTLGNGLVTALRKRGFTTAAPQDAAAEDWIAECASTSAIIRANASFLPDFQG